MGSRKQALMSTTARAAFDRSRSRTTLEQLVLQKVWSIQEKLLTESEFSSVLVCHVIQELLENVFVV